MTLYLLLKFIHIASAAVWIGGALSATAITWRLAFAEDGRHTWMLAPLGQTLGITLGPAAALTLISGAALVAVGGLAVQAWIVWGFAVMILSAALGATVLRRTVLAISGHDPADGNGEMAALALRQRYALFAAINLLLLFSAVWVMVIKPTFTL